MKMRALIQTWYSNPRISKAVSMAVSPDNLKIPPGLKILTKRRGNRVISEVVLEGRIETLLNTLDDLMACTRTAESVVDEKDKL